MLAPIRTVAPATTPVSVDELKAHLRVDFTDDDDLISSLLDAATQYFDGYSGILGRVLITQTWAQDFSDFWLNDLVLPLAPVSSVTVTYYDTANVLQTLDASIYSLLNDARGPFLSLNYGMVWPNHYVRPDAIRALFVAGYGAATAVPVPIKQAIKLLVGDWYESRETAQAGRIAALPYAVDALVAPYRRVGV